MGLPVVGQRPQGDTWCGASDMIGNAAELCFPDQEGYYLEPVTESFVARGGSYNSDKFSSRVTSRHSILTTRKEDIGIRIVIRRK